jgi:hypothetical protein
MIVAGTNFNSEDELGWFKRDADFMIVCGPQRADEEEDSGSEEALATLACASSEARPQPHLLIGAMA